MSPRHLGILVSAWCASACGGGAATLYPAHVLAQNQVSAGAGVSDNFAFGKGGQTIAAGPATSATNAQDPEQTFVDESVRNALLAPGIAPWVGARVGLGGHNEAGVTYTGRSARIDARHSFSNDEVALSIGLGASGILMHPGSYRPPAPGSPLVLGRFTDQNTELVATGWGLELPVIAGWRSTGSIVSVWGGVRAGFERIAGDLPVTNAAADTALRAELVGSRFWGGGLVGFAVGIRPIWIALELDAAYQAMSASASFPAETTGPAGRSSTLSGATLAPTGAVIGKFW